MQATSVATTTGTETSDASARELARDMLAVTLHVFRASSKQYYEVLEQLDLSFPQLKTLDALQGEAEVSVKELSELVGTSLPATSRNVEALLRRGYLERREDERDRRCKLVRLTAVGRETVGDLNSARLAGMEEFAATLSERQRARLRAALACLVERTGGLS